MLKFRVVVTVTSLVRWDERDFDDQQDDPCGNHTFDVEADNKEAAGEKALDVFHDTIPIACLDDFDITTSVRPC